MGNGNSKTVDGVITGRDLFRHTGREAREEDGPAIIASAAAAKERYDAVKAERAAQRERGQER